MDSLLILRRIKVENANAIAGLTWGFPALSHFLGFTHALQRRWQRDDALAPALSQCAIICHQHQVHSHQASSVADHVFALTRNPLTKEEKTAPFNEEGRMHMEVTLVIGMQDLPPISDDELSTLRTQLSHWASCQRLAGGNILSIGQVDLISDVDHLRQPSALKKLLRSFLPGYLLVNRADILADHQTQTGKTPLDAWMDFSSLASRAVQDSDTPTKATWPKSRPPYGGWLRPINVGYQAISGLYAPGTVNKSRDTTTPVCFVESVYSLGEWLSPHRITSLESIFWRYQFDAQQGLYYCANDYQAPSSSEPTITALAQLGE
ncbi:type I-F CRISPR-associated protein Csy2 [Pokkaliibacter sp. MBI-7]|uniref:type I-F CRISPR-associated protein Csy2 n=1 Tax=Pokkaliibacter sp. MBI-7 TaxID=3040600 RepID=UPI00244904AF|nr:type I-F CRISPR-associated protein Csy2 [Pokkaliibacter sp. MBI-7]MDH2434353.1 type I-F CRISPR-associated protein Csy2 [Pokkaliibacter sp. MBI-7]